MPSMEDLRTRKTKAAIESAMMELIELKGYSKVKIIDIANRAQVNRNTIYLHYESKEDIALSIIKNTYGENAFISDIDSLFVKRIHKSDLYSLFEKLINKIDANIELYRIFLTDNSLSGYSINIISNIQKHLKKYLLDSPNNTNRIIYILSGIYGVMSRWIVYAKGNKEDIVKELTDLTYSNIFKLEVKK